MSKLVPLDRIGDAFKEVLDEAAEKDEKIILNKVSAMPRRFEHKAKRYFTKVLRVRSGNLRRSIKGFRKKLQTDIWNLGLMAGGEVAQYAQIQHEGGFTRPHIIRPRVAKVLSWVGTGGKRMFAKSVRHPGGYIPPTKFLQRPLILESNKMIKELVKEIGL